MAGSSGSTIMLYILALFIPPVSVGIVAGCGADVIINIALWIFGWIPGVIHAWWIVGKHDPARY